MFAAFCVWVKEPNQQINKTANQFINWQINQFITDACLLFYNVYCLEGIERGVKPATTISSLSHILLIFSSEPPRNPRPSNIFLLKCSILQDKTIF